MAALLTAAAACGAGTPSSTAGSTGSTSPGTQAVVTALGGTEVPGTRPTGDLAFLGPVRQVAVDDVSIGYRRFGTGPPLVLIIGQDSAMSYWGPDLPRRLAEHFEVTMFDNRGVGFSTDQPDQPLTIERMADDTAGLIDALGLDHPTIFGWSTGGEIALALAVDHPDQTGPVMVSGATAGGAATVPAPPELDALVSSSAPADQVRLLDALFTPSGAAARQRYIDGVLSMPAETVSPEITRRQAESEAAFVASGHTSDGLASVRTPLLVTDGADDLLVPIANAHFIADQVPGAQLVVVPDASHAWMVQDLDRFVELVRAFSRGEALP